MSTSTQARPVRTAEARVETPGAELDSRGTTDRWSTRGGRPLGTPVRERVSARAARRWRVASAQVAALCAAESAAPAESAPPVAPVARVAPIAPAAPDSQPDTLRRAVRFIEDNAALELTAADVARAASVSVRALQLAFRRHLDTTPMAYLRQVRLARARCELEAAREESVTVTSVASRWGFGNPGRFAAQFRDAFGASPSEVLRAR